MKYDNLLLAGMVYRKKAPSEWEMDGRTGLSYSIIIDCFETVDGIDSDTTVTLKVSQAIFDALEIGNKYIFNCSANIAGKDSSFQVRGFSNPISGAERYTIASSGSRRNKAAAE